MVLIHVWQRQLIDYPAKKSDQDKWLNELQIRWKAKVCIKSFLLGEHRFQELTTLKIIITRRIIHSYMTVKCFNAISLNIPLDTNTHVASMTTPTPAGLTASVRAMAICFVRRS